MQYINYNYEEYINSLNFTISSNLWKGPHIDDLMIESGL